MIFPEINGSVLNLFFTFAATFAASDYTAAEFVGHFRSSFTHNSADHFPVGFHHTLHVDGRKVNLADWRIRTPAGFL